MANGVGAMFESPVLWHSSISVLVMAIIDVGGSGGIKGNVV
jgi:hypothetical protein